jgi:hypothetical protein
MSYDVFTGLLKMFDEFQENTRGIALSHDLSHENLQKLKAKYALDEKAGDGKDLSRAINLLKWVSENIHHSGMFMYEKPENAMNLLDDYYQRGKDYSINCRALSRILTECLLALGIRARTLFLMPALPYDVDCHVVTHAYIKELGRWIMLDPTFNSYVMDKNKNILNVFEIRELLKDQGYIFFNEGINHNGDEVESDFYKEYLAKNLFYLVTGETSRYGEKYTKAGQRGNEDDVYFIPKNYDIRKASMLRWEYGEKKIDDKKFLELIKKAKQETMEEEYRCIALSKLTEAPK